MEHICTKEKKRKYVKKNDRSSVLDTDIIIKRIEVLMFCNNLKKINIRNIMNVSYQTIYSLQKGKFKYQQPKLDDLCNKFNISTKYFTEKLKDNEKVTLIKFYEKCKILE